MTQQAWLLQPLLTGVFFVLGVVLLFQLIMNAFINYTDNHYKRYSDFNLQLHALGATYFSLVALYFEISASSQHNQYNFANFRLLMLFYVVMFLGQRSSALVVFVTGLSHVILNGLVMESFYYLLIIGICYIIISAFMYAVHQLQLTLFEWSFILDVFAILFWMFCYFNKIPSFGIVSDKMVTFNIIAFVTMNLGLSIGITRMTDARAHLKTITRQATVDSITNLKNYTSFSEDYRQQLHLARKFGTPMTLIAIDLDHFKKINDRYGHLSGNRILNQLGSVLENEATRISNATVYRVGGEEFDILLTNQNAETIYEFSHTLQNQVQQSRFNVDNNESISLTISVGVATLRNADTDDDTLYERADQMLYRSKGQGRNQINMDTNTEE